MPELKGGQGGMPPEGAKVGAEARPAMKAVKMPTREHMAKTFEEKGLVGDIPQVKACYDKFADMVADKDQAAVALNLAWETAKNETMRGQPRGFRALVDIGFEQTIDAVTPDPEVAAEVKEVREEMLRRMRLEESEK